MKFKITMEGISFGCREDTLTWLWPWNRDYEAQIFHSKLHGYFSSKEDHWFHLGYTAASQTTSPEKVKGYPSRTILLDWARTNLRFGYFVILHDIDVQSKSKGFWNKIPEKDRLEFGQDIVVLTCKDLKEVHTLCNSISTDFALAEGMANGVCVYWNEDHRKNEATPPLTFENRRV